MEEKQVVVGKYENEIDAEIAKGHPEASGISAFIIKDDGGGMFPSMQSTEGIQVVVAESKREIARELLRKKGI